MGDSRRTRRAACVAVLVVVFAGASPASDEPPTQTLDVLIRDGQVLDGTGNPAVRADIGIRGDRIVAIGKLGTVSARRTIEATGLHVVPGFIDMHSHADRGLAGDDPEERKAHHLVFQGITTAVVGPDGRNHIWPIADEIAAYRSPGTALNVVPMVGHSTVREQVMGDDYERPAAAAEIEQMRALVREGMVAGAWGLGAGPEYRPGRFATTEELIALAHVVAEYDGFYYAHQRSQGAVPMWQTPSMVDGWRLTGFEGLSETIRIGRETGIRVVGSHIKASGRQRWGASSIDILLIERARAEGVQVYLDQYPYLTFGCCATSVLPRWAYAPPDVDHSGGLDDAAWDRPEFLENHEENLRAHLADPESRATLLADTEHLLETQGGADRQIIVLAPPDDAHVGKTLAKVAQELGRTPIEQLLAFALEQGTPELPSGVLVRPVGGHAFDVDNYMVQDYTATTTDASIQMGRDPGRHPRYYGTYPRKLGHYARERGLISLPFAVRSSTSLPAQIVGLSDRGVLRVGGAADLVVFDYDTIIDHSTILEPHRYPTGMHYVMVNGQLALDAGQLTGVLAGQVLERTSARREDISRGDVGGSRSKGQ